MAARFTTTYPAATLTSQSETTQPGLLVTKTKYNYTIALTESANFTIGETNLNFEISKATKETLADNPIVITFENDGTVVSVEGLYNLTSTDDKLFVSGEYVTNEYGGLPVISRNGNLEYISVSDGYFTFTGGTQGNQTIEVSHNASVDNNLDDVTIIVDPKISNGNDNILVSGTSDDDTISNYGSKVTIKAGAGNDYILNDYDGSSVTIDGGDGDDYIENLGGSIVSISGGKGNDTISTDNYEADYYETDYDGNSVLRHETYEAKNNTINGGAGDDLISLGSNVANNLIQYKSGDGNDIIYGFNDSSTLKIGGGKGTYSSLANADDDIIVEVGKGKITLKGAAKLSTLNIDGEYKAPLNIVGTEGNDNIENTLEGATIQALGGKDSVTNSGNDVLLNGGAGNDTIFNNGHSFDGDPHIPGSDYSNQDNYGGRGVTINGGTGNDYIENSGEGVTIEAGAGNDTISLENFTYENLIKYTEGDGNDLIQGFGEDDTLQIGGNSYSTQKSGDNIIVTVGKGKITLEGAAYLNTLNIVSDKPSWTLDGTTAKYGTNDNTLATVKGVKSLDGISLNKKVITVKKASLGTDNVTVSDGYTLALGSDVTKSSTSKAAWSLNKTTATYSQTTTAGYTLANDGKSVSYSKATTTVLASVKGAKSVKGLSVSGETITLKNSSLSNKVTVSGAYEFDFASDYKQATITGSSNDDTITARGLKVSINGGNGNDTIKIFGSSNTVTGGAGFIGGKGDDILIGGAGNDSLWGDAGADNFIYSSGDGNDIIYGFDNKDKLTLDGLELTSGSYNKSKGELTLKVDGGSIMLKEFTATSFNVNGTSYKISGTKLIKK